MLNILMSTFTIREKIIMSTYTLRKGDKGQEVSRLQSKSGTVVAASMDILVRKTEKIVRDYQQSIRSGRRRFGWYQQRNS